MQVGTHYWFNKRTQKVEKFDKNYCVKDHYRPAYYEEVKEYKVALTKHKREVVLNGKFGFKPDSGNYRSWKYGMKTLDEAYEIEMKASEVDDGN